MKYVWAWTSVGVIAFTVIVLATFGGPTRKLHSGEGERSGKDNSGWGGGFTAIGAAAAAIASAFGAAGREAAAAAGYRPTGTISSATPGVQVGRTGAWRDVTPGTQIDDGDFIKIPAGDSATVTMPDGSTKVVAGKAIIPGTWINGSVDDFWARVVQQGAEMIVGKTEKTKGNGGGKA